MQYDLQIENYMAAPMGLERYYDPHTLLPAQEAYEATERRLYRMPVLREHIAADKEDLAALETGELDMLAARPMLVQLGRARRSRSPQEIREDQMARLQGRLAMNQRELRRMEAALAHIREDHYYPAIELRYFQGMKEADIAERLNCDPTTVCRNRRRLVKQLAFRLYGV